ncbi:MAG: hypothetical protein PHC43_00950 [Candidatus Marinimicrobia bacterium]|nr:hypothetical protein [Candidatus Neomarinimicrobiota bacterium]
MKRLTTLIMLILICSVVLIKCGDDDEGASFLGPGETESAIVGSWIREVVKGYNYAGLSFLEDGTYYYVNMTSPTAEPYNYREGQYYMSGKTLTLGPDDASCNGDGIYEVSITEDQKKMTLKKASDDCEVRSGELPGSWQRVED